MRCGVVPILFGCFLRVPSLHVLVFLRKLFCDLLDIHVSTKCIRAPPLTEGSAAWHFEHGGAIKICNENNLRFLHRTIICAFQLHYMYCV